MDDRYDGTLVKSTQEKYMYLTRLSTVLQLITGASIDIFLNLNLISLLVTRQMTLFHQGVRMGEKLVP